MLSMDLGTGIAILGGIASVVYIVETAAKLGYPLLKKSQVRPLVTTSPQLTLPLVTAFKKKV